MRRVLDVRALSEPASTSDLPLTLSVPTTRSAASHASGMPVRAWVYVWAKDVSALERDIWESVPPPYHPHTPADEHPAPTAHSFQSFLRDKASRWTGLTDPASARNTDAASRAGGGDPAEYRAVDRMREARAEGEARPPAFGKALLKYWKFDKDCA